MCHFVSTNKGPMLAPSIVRIPLATYLPIPQQIMNNFSHIPKLVLQCCQATEVPLQLFNRGAQLWILFALLAQFSIGM